MADSYVCSGAKICCTKGSGETRLTVLPPPVRTVLLTGKPQANVSDHAPLANIGSCGKCSSLLFPATRAATAAHHGHLTPMPCVPGTLGNWQGGKDDYIIQGYPALLKSSTCQCVYGGTISLITDGQKNSPDIDLIRTQRERISLQKAKEIVVVEIIEEMEKGNPTILDFFLDGAKEVYNDGKELVNDGKELINEGKELINEGKDIVLDKVCDVIYEYGGDEVVEIMDDIAKGKYFGTEQWKYLLDQSYDLMEDGYVEGNFWKKNAGSAFYLICSAWQEDTWINTFETVRMGDGLINSLNNPSDKMTKMIEKANEKIKFLNISNNTARFFQNITNAYSTGNKVKKLFGQIKKFN